MKKEVKQTTVKKSKKWVIPLVGVLALGAGGAGGYFASTALNKKNINPEIEKAHEIVIEEPQIEGYTITCDKQNAKMGDVVNFEINTNASDEEKKTPKALQITATNDKGKEISSYYELKSQGSGIYTAEVTITYISKMTVTLVFDEAEYVVTFNSDSGTPVPSIKAKYGEKIAEPTTTREGHTFLGWYNGQNKWNFSTDTIKEDTTLTAHWQINEYTVSFDTDGGSEAPSSINVEWNSTIPESSKPIDPTKPRYTFDGWYLNGEKFIFGTTKVTSSITLVAKWNIVDAYTVMFDTNGGQIVDSQTVYKGEFAIKPSGLPSKMGYLFKEWYDKPQTDASAVVFDFTNTPITDNTTIYAHWDVCSCNVSFVDSVAQKSIKQISVKYGESIKTSDLPSTAKEGYKFVGWSKQMTVYDPFDITQPITSVTKPLSIYMYYEPITITGIEILTLPTRSTYHLETTQTQTLDLTGLSVKMIYSYGDPITVTDFSTGWTNSGFVTTSLGEKTVKLTHTDSTKSISFKVNIVNQFTSLAITQQPTTISYGQGGTFTPKGLKVQLTDYEGTAQTEVEWTTDSITEHQAKGYTITAPDMSTVGNKEVTVTYGTLTAKFPITVTDVMYTVTFNINDAGTSSSTFTQIVKKGDKIVEPAEPTSTTGKIWLGWYVDQAGTSLYDFTQTVSSQPSTIYGKWEDSACFNGVRWGTVVNACNTYESIESPTLDQAKMLCRALNVDASDQTGVTATQCLENKLIGKTGKISINGKLHAVRCIGTNHDTIQGSTKTATLTFELANVLSDSEGKAFYSLWDLKDNKNINYTSSVLYKNLVGTDDQASWYGSSDTRTAWQMLLQGNLELAAGIKTVQKEVSMTNNHTVTQYNTKLFPLTNYEMNRLNPSYYNKEGTKYDKFYTSSTTTQPVSSLIKKDLAGTANYYWTTSACIEQNYEEEVYIVTNTGYVGRGTDYLAIFNQSVGVSFAFCI